MHRCVKTASAPCGASINLLCQQHRGGMAVYSCTRGRARARMFFFKKICGDRPKKQRPLPQLVEAYKDLLYNSVVYPSPPRARLLRDGGGGGTTYARACLPLWPLLRRVGARSANSARSEAAAGSAHGQSRRSLERGLCAGRGADLPQFHSQG